ncbi:exodeoxyribonuclease VII small subunit, partial [Staphylococcus pseudintermedius]
MTTENKSYEEMMRELENIVNQLEHDT